MSKVINNEVTEKDWESKDFLIRLNYVETSEPDRIAKDLQNKDKRISELEEELAELKENSIVPKFYYQDEVYYIENVITPKIIKCTVENIIPYSHKKFYSYSIRSNKPHYYNVREQEIFATKEEAQKALEVLQNGK